MTSLEVRSSINQILSKIHLVSPEVIANKVWIAAWQLLSEIDEKDTPFLATAMSLEAYLWTGDKKLIQGLKQRGYSKVFSTAELFDLRQGY